MTEEVLALAKAAQAPAPLDAAAMQALTSDAESES